MGRGLVPLWSHHKQTWLSLPVPIGAGFSRVAGEKELLGWIVDPGGAPTATEGGVSPEFTYRSQFSNLSTTDILEQRILCWGGGLFCAW